MDKNDRDPRRPFRRALNLDGEWEFVTDPEDEGRTKRWSDPGADWPDRARTVTVPWTWEETETYREYTGTAWYRRTFEFDRAANGRPACLRFGAVDYETTVWINGQRVGSNRGGYLPFEIDVTDALVDGENAVVVSVTDPADLSEIPHGKQGDPWYTRVSGIWQSVRLLVRPTTHVRSAHVTPDLGADTAVVDLDVESAAGTTDSLDAMVYATLDGQCVATGRVALSERSELVLAFDDPTYWSPTDPMLYDLEVALERDGRVVDRYETYFGMRSFERRNGRFLLNGEPFTMRGVLDQGYYPETLYRPPDTDIFAEEIAVAREAGFNLIRKHIKPAHPDFLEQADREGMLVWEEPANPTVYTERSRAEVRTQLLDLIERDYNHPSVVVWSLYNEEWGIGHHDVDETLWTDEEKQQFLADLYLEVREADPTRLVCDNSGWAHVATDINDYHRYFVSPDRAAEWAADLDHVTAFPGDNYATTTDSNADTPIVVSELGTWGICDVDALRERYGGDPHWFSHEFLTQPLKTPAGIDERFDRTGLSDVFEDYANLATAWQDREFVSIKHLLGEMRTRPGVAGYVLTELSDIEWEFNGILDYHREPKNFVSALREVNGPVAVVARAGRRAVWAGESVKIELSIVNDTGSELSGTLQYSLGDARDAESMTVQAHGVHSTEVTLTAPSDATRPVTTATLSVAFESAAQTARTAEPFTVVDGARRTTPSATVYAEGEFASRLAENGLAVTHTLSESVDVAVATAVSDRIERFAAAGGPIIQIPATDGATRSGGPFSYRTVPRTESWNVVASFYYQDSPLLDGLCSSRRLGWEFDGAYPSAVATNLDLSDDVHVGYVEGWLAKWGSPLVTRQHEQGTMTACTFPVSDEYGQHPTATALCDRLLDRLSE